MKYEALYTAVASGAPAVLIAFVLEYRLMTKGSRSNTRGHKALAGTIIGATGVSCMLSLVALSTAQDFNSRPYAVLVLSLILGALGALMALLYESVVSGFGDNEETSGLTP